MALSRKGRSGDVNAAEWFRFDDDTEALIARWDNDKYSVGLQRFRTVFQEKSARLLKQAGAGESLRFTGELAEVEDGEQTEFDAQCMLMARHIVRDMRTPGRKDSKLKLEGELATYNHELGEDLLKTNVDFFLWVTSKAQKLQADAYALAESAEKKP